MTVDIPFEGCHSGTCYDCHRSRTLDEMIRKDTGVYHCKDCEVEDAAQGYVFVPGGNRAMPVDNSRMRKLLGWCLG